MLLAIFDSSHVVIIVTRNVNNRSVGGSLVISLWTARRSIDTPIKMLFISIFLQLSGKQIEY